MKQRSHWLRKRQPCLRCWEVAPRRSDAEIVVVNSGTVVDDAFIAQVPSMQLCVTNTSGFDHLDLDLLRRKGVTVARLPLARRDAVVESAIWGTLQVEGARGEQLDVLRIAGSGFGIGSPSDAGIRRRCLGNRWPLSVWA